MPSYVVKTAPDEDFYVVWSTVVDNITFAGTRAEVLKREPEDRITRADLNGTSAMWPEEVPGPNRYLGWEDETMLVHNDPDPRLPAFFLIRRADLRQYVEHGAEGIWMPCEED